MITSEEQQAIHNIKGSPGYRVMEFLIRKKIEELDSVSNIKGKGEFTAGVEALAHKKAVEILRDFLNDLGFLEKTPSPQSKTYE